MSKPTKAHTRHMLTLLPDSLRQPPPLPDAAAVIDIGLDLSEDEITMVQLAMSLHSASKQPKLTWTGWKHVAVAVAIGSEHAKKKAKARDLADYQYRQLMAKFLRRTGFIFLNKNDRAAAVRMLPYWDRIDAWRTGLSPSRKAALNNPREVWRVYVDEQGDPETKPLDPHPTRRHRQFPNMIEQLEALQGALDAAEEQRDRAEAQADYFSEMFDSVARKAKLTQAEIAAIRAEARAKREPQIEDGEDD
jgi:hypothetical protein